MCLSKNILYQCFIVFCPAWDSLSSENILYVMSLHNPKQKTKKKSRLSAPQKLLDTDGHVLTYIYQDTGVANYFESYINS